MGDFGGLERNAFSHIAEPEYGEVGSFV